MTGHKSVAKKSNADRAEHAQHIDRLREDSDNDISTSSNRPFAVSDER